MADVFVGDGMAAIRNARIVKLFERWEGHQNLWEEGTGSREFETAPLPGFSIPKDVSSSPTAGNTGSKSSSGWENFSIMEAIRPGQRDFIDKMTSFTWPITNR